MSQWYANCVSCAVSCDDDQCLVCSTLPLAKKLRYPLKPDLAALTPIEQKSQTPQHTSDVCKVCYTRICATPTEQQPPVGENQIPEENEKDVTALKYGNKLTQQVSTIYVEVGGYVTPQAASVWDDVTIYSENTAIAVGEGVLVKGVAKGDTYVVVKTRGNMASAYHVIVE